MTSSADSPAKLRQYATADQETLIRAINEVCAEGAWMQTSRYQSTPAWEHAFISPKCACHLLLVAVAGSNLIGWCRVFGDQSPQSGEIGLGLLKDYREQGLGTQMISSAIDWAKEKGFANLTAWTREDNQRAQALFRKFNFKPSGRNSQHMLEMILNL